MNQIHYRVMNLLNLVVDYLVVVVVEQYGHAQRRMLIDLAAVLDLSTRGVRNN